MGAFEFPTRSYQLLVKQGVDIGPPQEIRLKDSGANKSGEMGDRARLSILTCCNAFEGLVGFGLVTVPELLGCARAFQRNSVRRLRTGLLLCRLRFGRGCFRGFGGMALV
jgi:hypothetical protein